MAGNTTVSSNPVPLSSASLFEKAKTLMPGGVNSPVRAFKAVGKTAPVFIKSAKGSKIEDVSGKKYIDYVGSWGPLIVGHADERVISAIVKAVRDGASFGAPTERENILAEMVIEAVPSIEMVRMVNSGTEATMSAIRLARGYTKRDVVVKFDGCYHGHVDSLLVKAGSGVETLGLPDSPGVPGDFAKNTITTPFNNLGKVKEIFHARGKETACIILEPVVGNMGVLPPAEGFLKGLRELCDEYGALLIFDEVMTGFRLSYGGAQSLYDVTPDLTTLGKIIGGGLPVGAYGGKKEIMEKIAPSGPVYQAGTLSGNPLAMAAGIATLSILKKPGTYEQLEKQSAKLAKGVAVAAREAGVNVSANRVGSMFSTFFTSQKVFDYETALTSDTQKFSRYFHLMLENSVYIAPSQFEAGFMSLSHSDADVEETIRAVSKSLSRL